MPLSFLIVCAVLSVIAVIAVLWPFLRGPEGGADETEVGAQERSGLVARLANIEADEANGTLDAAEAQAGRAEIARRMLALEAEGGDGLVRRTSLAASLTLAGATALFVVGGGVALYAVIGAPAYRDQPIAARIASGQDITVLVAQVESRLLKNPDDVEGWAVLAPVYLRTGRFSNAADAFGNLARLSADDQQRRASLLANQAEALTMAAQGRVVPRAQRIARAALDIDPANPKANFLEVLAGDQTGAPETALLAWRDLLARFPEEPDLVQFATQRIAALSSDATSLQPSDQGQPAPSGPTAEQIEDAGDMSAADRMAMIEGMVDGLAARLADDADDLSGWERLIRSYIVLQQDEKAREALATARTTFAQDEAALQTLAAFDAELAVTN
ncbi:MAG: c-type cytochrome biogenesis protein CcmI [Pseudomonadota bacterium]